MAMRWLKEPSASVLLCRCSLARQDQEKKLSNARLLSVENTTMRKIVLIGLVFAMTLLTAAPYSLRPITVNGAGNGDQIAPQVIDTTPERGEELALDCSITFYFSQPMDPKTVQ